VVAPCQRAQKACVAQGERREQESGEGEAPGGSAVLILYGVALTAATPGLVALLLPPQVAWVPLAGAAAWLLALGLLDWWSSTRR